MQSLDRLEAVRDAFLMLRSKPLDLLRAFAIVWVMFYHAQTFGYGSPWNDAARLGWIGVDLFFALSGYLIGTQLMKACAHGARPAFGPFYLRRAFRILPAYLAVLIVYWTWPAFREAQGMQPWWQFLTFTENLLVDFSHNRAFSHAWSLCVEEHFYLLFPLILWWLMRRPGMRKTAVVVAVIFVGGMMLRGFIWMHVLEPIRQMTDAKPGLSTLYMEKIYYPTYARLDGLLAGVVIAAVRLFRPVFWEKTMRHANLWLVTGIASVAAGLGLFEGAPSFSMVVFGFPLISLGLALIMAASLGPRCLLAKFTLPGAGAVAAIAYSLYLTHKQVFHLVKVYLPSWLGAGGVQTLCVYAGATLAAGLLLYWCVERPFLRLRDKLLN